MAETKLPKTTPLEEDDFLGKIRRNIVKVEKRRFKALKVGNAFIVPYSEDGLKFYFLATPEFTIDTGNDESEAADAFFELVDLLKTTSKIEQVVVEADAYLIERTLYNKHTNTVESTSQYWLIEWDADGYTYAIELDDVEQLVEEL